MFLDVTDNKKDFELMLYTEKWMFGLQGSILTIIFMAIWVFVYVRAFMYKLYRKCEDGYDGEDAYWNPTFVFKGQAFNDSMKSFPCFKKKENEEDEGKEGGSN